MTERERDKIDRNRQAERERHTETKGQTKSGIKIKKRDSHHLSSE